VDRTLAQSSHRRVTVRFGRPFDKDGRSCISDRTAPIPGHRRCDPRSCCGTSTPIFPRSGGFAGGSTAGVVGPPADCHDWASASGFRQPSSTGTSAVPQIGQVPGRLRTMWVCAGQLQRGGLADEAAAVRTAEIGPTATSITQRPAEPLRKFSPACSSKSRSTARSSSGGIAVPALMRSIRT